MQAMFPSIAPKVIIIVFNLVAIRLQWSEKTIEKTKKRAKFTFPFWKLRKSELFYLQLVFWALHSAEHVLLPQTKTRGCASEKNCCFIHQPQRRGIGAIRTHAVCFPRQTRKSKSKMKLLVGMCSSELHFIDFVDIMDVLAIIKMESTSTHLFVSNGSPFESLTKRFKHGP